MHGFALFLIGSPVWNAWEDLEYAVRTGQLPFDRLFGMPFYNYLEQHPENLKIFGEAMTSLSGTENPEFAARVQDDPAAAAHPHAWSMSPAASAACWR